MREYDLTLQADRFDGKDPDKLTPARREELIENWLRTRTVTREELAVAMRRQAYLRPIADRRVTITESMLRQEYDRVHGEKVEVLHIQIPAPRFYPQIKERLEKGESFEALVKAFSQNALSRDQGGKLPPFAASDDSVPAIFVKAAFAMKPGEVSNLLEAEGSYHVLKLERKVPADGAKFEDARPHLERPLRARLVAKEMETLAERLLLSAQLRISDPVLREQYEKRLTSKEIAGPPLSGP
jgi:foldase protein PrsA